MPRRWPTRSTPPLPGWVQRCVTRLVTAWSGQVPPDVAAAAAAAGEQARRDLVPQVRALLAADIDEQTTTPLALLRAGGALSDRGAPRRRRAGRGAGRLRRAGLPGRYLRPVARHLRRHRPGAGRSGAACGVRPRRSSTSGGTGHDAGARLRPRSHGPLPDHRRRGGGDLRRLAGRPGGGRRGRRRRRRQRPVGQGRRRTRRRRRGRRRGGGRPRPAGRARRHRPDRPDACRSSASPAMSTGSCWRRPGPPGARRCWPARPSSRGWAPCCRTRRP